METIIELYDSDPVMNYISPCALKPKNVVYLCEKHSFRKNHIRTVRSFYKLRKQKINAVMYKNKGSVNDYLRSFEEIYRNFPGCCIDVTGGEDTALVAAGMFTCIQKDARLISYDQRKNRFSNIYNCIEVDKLRFQEKFRISELIAMSGALVTGHGHFNPGSLTGEALADIDKIWKIYLDNLFTWHKNVQYLQAVSKLHSGSLHVEASMLSPSSVGRFEKPQRKIMQELGDAGIIKNLSFTAGSIVFGYKNDNIRRCLTDVGMCLELFVYKTALEADFFDDVSISVIIDWNGRIAEPNDTTNEIDVMLTKGLTPVFISCKTGIPSTASLNEVHTLATRLGGSFAKPVLATMNNLKETAPSLCNRAAELGVTLIELDDLVDGRLEGILRKLV